MLSFLNDLYFRMHFTLRINRFIRLAIQYCNHFPRSGIYHLKKKKKK